MCNVVSALLGKTIVCRSLPVKSVLLVWAKKVPVKTAYIQVAHHTSYLGNNLEKPSIA